MLQSKLPCRNCGGLNYVPPSLRERIKFKFCNLFCKQEYTEKRRSGAIKWCVKCKRNDIHLNVSWVSNGFPQYICKSCATSFNRAWRNGSGQRKRYIINRRYIDKNPEKQIAWRAAQGKIKMGPCVVCGAERNVHRHHPDYSKPLYVVMLCASHHVDIHTGKIALEDVSSK